MGFFDDNVYQDMDWLSKATAPLVFSGIEILAELPDEIPLTKEFLDDCCRPYSSSIYKGTVLDPMLDNSSYHITWRLKDMIRDCFRFEHNGETQLLPKEDVYPEIKLVKHKTSLEEKDILNYVLESISNILHSNHYQHSEANEMLDLLDYNGPARSSRSAKKKRIALISTYRQIIKDDKWLIRDADLMIKIAKWIQEYVTVGNLAALTNVTKLKIMTHKQQPIYSIQETV